MLAPASVSIRLYVCNRLLLDYVYMFFLNFCRAIETKKQKKGAEAGFLGKFLFAPKIDKKSPKKSFFTYLVLSLLFARGNLK